MASNVRVGSATDLSALENSCNSFTEGLRDAVGAFGSATGELGSSWRDAQFRTIEGLADEIVSVCSQAQDVVGNLLMPFVQRKRAALESRPS